MTGQTQGWDWGIGPVVGGLWLILIGQAQTLLLKFPPHTHTPLQVDLMPQIVGYA